MKLGIVVFLSFLALSACTGGSNKEAQEKKDQTFFQNLNAEPSSLNPITSSDLYESAVNGYVLDSLLQRDIETYEWQLAIAESYKVSDEGTKFTFTLRDGVKFHDGKPVTVEDVKFSYDVYFMEEYAANNIRPYYENINPPKIIDQNTIEFTTKNKYHLNFDVVAGLTIYPKHIYGDPKVGKEMNRKAIGAGPFKHVKWQKGKRIILEKNKDWYGWGLEHNKGKYSYDFITFRFARNKNIALEMLKKGNIDYLEIDPETFVRKAKGEMWGKDVEKHKVKTKQPKPYRYIGFNLRKPLFQDLKIRKALAHLMNRDLMIEKFYYGMYEKTAGPTFQHSYYADPDVKPIEFDPDQALELLREAGWKDTDKDGVLDKVVDGQKTPLRFTIINANPDVNKFFTIYKEDAKKVGVDIVIKLVEWNSLVKLLDEGNFDTVALGWGGGAINWDPKQIWHSAGAVKGGSNYVNYKNPKVDKLIDQARKIMDKKKRQKILHEVYTIIAKDVPYIFMFNPKFELYANTTRMKFDEPSFEYGIGTTFWDIEK